MISDYLAPINQASLALLKVWGLLYL